MRHRSRGLALVVLATSLAACGAGGAASTTAGVDPYEGGEISEARYKGIVQYVRDCMEEQGYSVTDVYQRDDGLTYAYDFEDRMGDDDFELLSECEGEVHLMDAEVAYQDQNTLTGAEREEQFALFAECMTNAGVEVTAADDGAAVAEKMRAFVDGGGAEMPVTSCYTRYSTRLYGFE